MTEASEFDESKHKEKRGSQMLTTGNEYSVSFASELHILLKPKAREHFFHYSPAHWGKTPSAGLCTEQTSITEQGLWLAFFANSEQDFKSFAMVTNQPAPSVLGYLCL